MSSTINFNKDDDDDAFSSYYWVTVSHNIILNLLQFLFCKLGDLEIFH